MTVVKLITGFILQATLLAAFVSPSSADAKTKQPDWTGSYRQEGGTGKMLIEKEGKKLWIELSLDAGPNERKYEVVFFASVHNNTAKRLPFQTELCPHSFTLLADGVKMVDECVTPSQTYYFEKVK